jgi:hypothetical protein
LEEEGERERGGGRGGRGWRWSEYIRIRHYSFPGRIVMNSRHEIVPGRRLIMGIYWNQGIISPPWSVDQATKFDTNPVLPKLALNVFP